MSDDKIKIGDRLFLYGTLREGECRWQYIEKLVRPLGVTSYTGAMMYDFGPFPAVRLTSDNSGVIFGDVVEVKDDSISDICDRIEGHPHHYKRELVNTPLGQAWIYVYQSDPTDYGKLIMSGNWKNRKKAA